VGELEAARMPADEVAHHMLGASFMKNRRAVAQTWQRLNPRRKCGATRRIRASRGSVHAMALRTWKRANGLVSETMDSAVLCVM
jgi:hypothetical protein